MTDIQGLALLAYPILASLFAVGALIFIKTLRRRQGTSDPRFTEAVPVNPMSASHARRLRLRYLIAAAVVVTALLVLLIMLAGSAH